jgi:hypothetical protein
MASFDASVGRFGRPLPGGSLRRAGRAPWRHGAFSPEETASALQARRAELLREARSRPDSRGVPLSALNELVDEAIATVVMMRRPIVSDAHLLGAFWKTLSLLFRHHREGRHRLRVGSRIRADFDLVARQASAEGSGPQDAVELKERVALAADFAAQLTAHERRVTALMARRGVGVKHAARTLGLPVADVRAAVRSADAKLDRVAVIAAAGRLCDYRRDAIASYAAGRSTTEEEERARAHLAACTACRTAYAPLIRELRGAEFQRRLSAAFLPIPALPAAHQLGGAGRVLAWIGDQLPFGGPGERVAEVLGGAGIVKVAAAGGAAVMLATATISTGVHSLESSRRGRAPVTHRHAATARRSSNKLAPTSTPDARDQATAVTPQATESSVHGSTPLTPTQRAYREFSLAASATTAPIHQAARSKRSVVAHAASVASSESEATGTSVSSVPRSSAAASADTSAAEREFGGP